LPGEDRVLRQVLPPPGQVCGGVVGKVFDKGPEETLCGEECTRVMAMWCTHGEAPLRHVGSMSSLLLVLGVAIAQGEAFSATHHCASLRDATAAAACRGGRCAGNVPPPLLAQTLKWGARGPVPTRMMGKSPKDVGFSTSSEVPPSFPHTHAAHHSLFSLQFTHVLRAQARTNLIQWQQSSACSKTLPGSLPTQSFRRQFRNGPRRVLMLV